MTTPVLDFPVTRALIGRLDSMVHALAAGLAAPVRMPLPNSFRWEYPDKTAEVVQVVKAVRAASGLRAALHLADLGFTAECGAILRTVSDFSAEIIYLAEAVLEGRLTEDQERFVAQHFSTLPPTPDELAKQERDRYPSRDDILRAHNRMAERTGAPRDPGNKMTKYLNKEYDAIVHGHHQSTMELFNGQTKRFMLNGHESARYICSTKVAVAGKLYEALLAYRVIALVRGLTEVEAEIRNAYSQLDASQEDTSVPCSGL